MKGWIELHTFYHGEPILINTANITCVMDHYVFVVKENNLVYEDEDETESVTYNDNPHVRETYEEIKALILEASHVSG